MNNFSNKGVAKGVVFTTTRLEAHFLTPKNQNLLEELYQKGQTSQHLKGLDAAKDIALTQACYQENNNVGAYLIFHGDSKEFIGFGGIHNQEPLKDGTLALEDAIEFLIMIDENHAGKGYAKEFSAAFLDFFFKNFPQKTLPARVSKDNIACINLLERLGFAHEGETVYYDRENKFYLLRKNL